MDKQAIPYTAPKLYNMVAGSPAELMLHEEAIRLARKGWGDPFRDWDYEVLTMETDKGLVVSALAFTEDEPNKAIVISLGTTLQGYRKCGLYRILWTRLIEIAKERGLKEIHAYRDPRNKESTAMSKAFGREDFSIGSRYKVGAHRALPTINPIEALCGQGRR